MNGGYVYILANRENGALYTGVTADIASRMMQHKAGEGSKFCREYGIDGLVFVEPADRIEDAIAREKTVKNDQEMAARVEDRADRKGQSRAARPLFRSQPVR